MEKDKLLDDHRNLFGDIDPISHLQYSVKLVTKNEFIENDIFTIHYMNTSNENRIGLIFPAFVIGSNKHDYYGMHYFEEYAKIAASFLLSIKEDKISDNCHIIIASDDYLLSKGLLLNDFEIAISKYGYYPCNIESAYYNKSCALVAANHKIIMNRTPRIFESLRYLSKLWYDILPSVSDPLARFVSLYQVIEMLMEVFFNEKIDEIRKTRTTIGNIRDKVSVFSSEKKIIDTMFSQYAIRMELNTDEKDIAYLFFGNDKDKQYYSELTLPSYIYDMRNAIIHNYYKYEFEEKMILIAERMEIIIIEILENEKIINLVKTAY